MTKPEFYQEDLDLIDVLVDEIRDSRAEFTLDDENDIKCKSRLNHLQSLWFRVEEMVDKSS